MQSLSAKTSRSPSTYEFTRFITKETVAANKENDYQKETALNRKLIRKQRLDVAPLSAKIAYTVLSPINGATKLALSIATAPITALITTVFSALFKEPSLLKTGFKGYGNRLKTIVTDIAEGITYPLKSLGRAIKGQQLTKEDVERNGEKLYDQSNGLITKKSWEYKGLGDFLKKEFLSYPPEQKIKNLHSNLRLIARLQNYKGKYSDIVGAYLKNSKIRAQVSKEVIKESPYMGVVGLASLNYKALKKHYDEEVTPHTTPPEKSATNHAPKAVFVEKLQQENRTSLGRA